MSDHTEDEGRDEERGEASFTRRLVDLGGDVVSRALVMGVSAVFMTEEGIRNAVSELRLPKDVARGLVQQADATKKDMFRIIGREVRDFLEHANMSASIARALADTTVEIRTTIRFRPNEAGGVTPEVSSTFGPEGEEEQVEDAEVVSEGEEEAEEVGEEEGEE